MSSTGFPSAGRFGAEAILSALGVPVTSTPVTVYLKGTLTPASLWTDQTRGTTTTNPISTDGLGNLTFYTDPGMYDLAFTVGGVATTQTVEVEPWWGDLAGMPFVSDYSVLAGSVPANPRWLHKTPSAVVTTTGGGIATVTFPTAFPHALTGLVICSGDTSGALIDVAIQQANVSLTGFTAECITNAVNGGTTSGNTVTNASIGLAASVTLRINYMADGC